MIGVQFTSCGFRIVHTNVVEDEPNFRRRKVVVGHERVNGVLIPLKEERLTKAYKCLMCGEKWVQNINAPLLMSSKDYEELEEKRDVVCYRLNGK